MPKSASVFVRTALELSAGLERHSFGGPIPFYEQADAQAFQRFLEADQAQGGQHMAASPYNLGLLREATIERLTLLLRDPRDALVSWRHNLERDDIDRLGAHRTLLVEAGQMPPDYYDLEWDAKADALIEHYLPRLIAWRDQWLAIEGFDLQVVHYEAFTLNQEQTIREILDFHQVEAADIHLPEIDRTGPLDQKTHFRRGEVGSHQDELSEVQVAMIEGHHS